MARLTHEQLAGQLAEAAKHVRIGALYRHYTGNKYKILALAFEESTMQVVVVYQAQYGEHITFTRPITVWDEAVKWEGRSVPRFELVD